MSATFESNDPVSLDNLKLPPLPKPICEITFPVYTIPARYEAWANDKGWGVVKTSGSIPERVAEKKFNNFERLRTLNLQEMALWLAAMLGVNPFDGTGNDYNKWLGWLKQEVEDGKTDNR